MAPNAAPKRKELPDPALQPTCTRVAKSMSGSARVPLSVTAPPQKAKVSFVLPALIKLYQLGLHLAMTNCSCSSAIKA
jgi:hypothetical protein